MRACGLDRNQERGLDRSSTDPRAILAAAFEARNGARSLSRLKMTIRNRSGTRERTMTMRSLRSDQQRKMLMMVEQPADLRNHAFLMIDHIAADRSDEQWVYLPKLHRASRVPPSGKADPMVGSDFAYSDLSQQSPDDFELKLLDSSAKVGDEECWLLEELLGSLRPAVVRCPNHGRRMVATRRHPVDPGYTNGPYT